MATGTIGAKIVLEGEAQYRKALRDINSAQKELRSEMKLCNTQYKTSQNSMDALQKKYQILSKQVETSAKKVSVYEKALQTSTQKEEQASNKVSDLTRKLELANQKYADMAKSSETTADAMDEQKNSIAELEKQLATANSDYDKAVEASRKYQTQLNLANAEMQEFENELKSTKKYMDEANTSSDGMAKSIDEFGDSVEDAEHKANTFGDVLKANLASEAIVTGVKALVSGIKEVAEACIETGMQFEASMSNVKALSGATDEELARLTEKAKELGASTIYSASEVADAMSYMALAGWNTEQTLQGIDSVLSLASASTMDLARASDIVTDYLTAFGLSAKDAEKFTDQLAYAMANSNTTVDMLGEAYKNCASTASSLGYSVEEVTAVLMTMANAGVKGGEAGTGLSSIMTRLATDAKGCASALKEYGVEIYNEKGEMNSLTSILQGMASVWGELTDQEQASLAKTIAGTQQYSKLQTIMKGLSEDAESAGMSFNDYAEALKSCDGYASDMAKTMQDNLKGKVIALQSALDGLKISTYEVFSENLKEGVQSATDAVARLNKSVSSGSMRTSLSKLSKSIGDLIEKVSNWAEKNLPKIIDGMSVVIDHSGEIASAIAGIVAGLVAFKTASLGITAVQTAMSAYKTVVEGATVAQTAMNVACDSNPYVLLASAVIGVTVAMAGLAISLENQSREAQVACDTMLKGYEQVRDTLSETTNDIESNNSSDYISSLVVEFNRLNSVESLSEEQKKRLAQVVKELNLYYSDLNLEIDENTGKVKGNTKEIANQVNTLEKERKVAQAQSDIAKAYSDRQDAVSSLADAQDRLKEIESEYADQTRRLTELAEKNGELTNAEANEMQRLRSEMGEAYNVWVELPEAIDSANAEIERSDRNIANMNSHFSDMYGVMFDATGAIIEVDDSMRKLGEDSEEVNRQIATLSEETSERISAMYDSVSSSIHGQMDLFSEWQEQSKISYEDLEKNLASQTTALEEWAKNLEYLSEKGIDEGLYQKLAEMGPEGASYVQAFVDMATKDNPAWQQYQENFRKAVAIQDTTAQEITQEYAELGGYILDGMVLGLGDDEAVTVAIGNVSQDMFDKFCEDNGINSPSKLYEEWAEYIPEGMSLGIENGEEDLLKTIETVSDDMISTAEDALDDGDFETIGENIDAGLSQGIENGKSGVIDTMSKMCAEIIETAQTALDIHSPSRKFKWLGEMSGEGYIQGLQDSMADVGDTINNSIDSMENVGKVANDSNSPMTMIANMIAEYLPEIANKDMNVNVSAEADADGIFKIVQKKSRQYTKATGSYAF